MARPRNNAPRPPTVPTVSKWPATPKGHFDSDERWRAVFIQEWKRLGRALMPLGATQAHLLLAEDLAHLTVTIAQMEADPKSEVTAINAKQTLKVRLQSMLFAKRLESVAPPAPQKPATPDPTAPRAFPAPL